MNVDVSWNARNRSAMLVIEGKEFLPVLNPIICDIFSIHLIMMKHFANFLQRLYEPHLLVSVAMFAIYLSIISVLFCGSVPGPS